MFFFGGINFLVYSAYLLLLRTPLLSLHPPLPKHGLKHFLFYLFLLNHKAFKTIWLEIIISILWFPDILKN